jgi:mRNA interferase MazF
MPSFSRSEVILVRYPFTDLSGAKVRAAVVINAPHVSHDVICSTLGCPDLARFKCIVRDVVINQLLIA